MRATVATTMRKEDDDEGGKATATTELGFRLHFLPDRAWTPVGTQAKYRASPSGWRALRFPERKILFWVTSFLIFAFSRLCFALTHVTLQHGARKSMQINVILFACRQK